MHLIISRKTGTTPKNKLQNSKNLKKLGKFIRKNMDLFIQMMKIQNVFPFLKKMLKCY
jgi:hypothetical protein